MTRKEAEEVLKKGPWNEVQFVIDLFLPLPRGRQVLDAMAHFLPLHRKRRVNSLIADAALRLDPAKVKAVHRQYDEWIGQRRQERLAREQRAGRQQQLRKAKELRRSLEKLKQRAASLQRRAERKARARPPRPPKRTVAERQREMDLKAAKRAILKRRKRKIQWVITYQTWRKHYDTWRLM